MVGTSASCAAATTIMTGLGNSETLCTWAIPWVLSSVAYTVSRVVVIVDGAELSGTSGLLSVLSSHLSCIGRGYS